MSFDARAVAGTAIRDDLDLDLFERVYLPSVLDPGVLAVDDRTLEQRLASLRLATLGAR